VAAALAAGLPGLLGLHLEGPHLNPQRRGVHDLRWLGPPDDQDEALMAPLGAGCTVVTLAPEQVALPVIERLAGAGVRVSAGHSAASYDQTQAALAAGVTGFTHLFNAMTPWTSREPGIAGAALDHTASWCGIIVDGHHLHDAAVRLAWRAKGPERLFLVTDAMPTVGTSAAGFRLGSQAIAVAAGRCTTADGRLAGSALDMATAVRHCVERIGIPLGQALQMASTTPAAFLGLSHRLGRIAPGYAADMVALDERLRVRETFIAGSP
jgi:N-acetylglucosamine-6-phosphate deacetylase